jgi:pimeloyl-ACP methyl ester carboxylesterase/class 3 adenylate cyclase
MTPEVRFAHSGEVSIAYQVIGDGPIDLVLVPGWISNLDVFWEEPNIARFFRNLASFSRLILFDKRGTGLSDRITEAATLEERMDDVRAVMDAVGSSRATLLGYSEGATMSILFAATHPDRTAALILVGGYARRLRAPDYPYFTDRDQANKAIDAAAANWGGPVGIEIRMPSVVNDPIVRQWWAKYVRASASVSGAAALQRMNIELDVRHLLPAIRVPVLVLHASRDRAIPIGAGRYIAERVPNAKFVEIDTADHFPFFEKSDEFLHHIQSFLTGSSTPEISESRVTTLMFTDIVGSTQLAVEKGDRRFADVLEAHHGAVRAELARYRGQELDTAGDGFLASFDGPARAIKCAMAIVRSLGALGLSSRIGLHTGECEVREGRLRGIALHVAARVAALAPPRGVLVSQTVRDLVAGSGLKFSPAGSHALKGLPDEWTLYEVAAPQ